MGICMIRPPRLCKGDTVAAISPSWGCAGARRVKWKYELGVRRLGYRRSYFPGEGYQCVQGRGMARGRLFGGHGSLMEYSRESGIAPGEADFKGAIFFFEDIPEVCSPDYMAVFFDWMGRNGYLQVVAGIIIGKMRLRGSFEPYARKIRKIVTGKYNLPELPIMSDLNFGHTAPICVLPYGAEAELDIDHLKFSVLESGVL